MSHLTAPEPVSAQPHSTIPTPPWGEFDLESNEFILQTPFAPRPWKNILWNKTFNTQPTQASGGISYKRYNDGRIVLLNWTGAQYIYLKNLRTGALFSPTFAPVGDKTIESYQYRVGLNYNTTSLQQHGLCIRIKQTVDETLPQTYFELEIENLTDQASPWRIVFVTELNLKPGGSKFSSTDRYVHQTCLNDRRLIMENISADDRSHAAFLECDQPFDGHAFNATDFTGIYGSLARPEALLEDWPETLTPVEQPILSGYVDCNLDAKGKQYLLITLGLPHFPGVDLTTHPESTTQYIHRNEQSQQKALKKLYSQVEVKTPDASFDLYINTWIKHQLNYCAQWNRGWGKGFRDSNQDAWAFTLLDAQRSRQMILDCLPHQFSDGRTVRSWGPVDRDAYNDGGVWLIFSTYAYLAETGDLPTLDYVAPFFESEESGTLYEHLCRGVNYLWKSRGEHGLCLMPYGDWNDRLTGIGKGGKGQSVWTTMALIGALRKMVEIANHYNQPGDVQTFTDRIDELVSIVRKTAWNGQWFSRAITDDGDFVGSPECQEGSIYLLPQAWSIISGIATDEQQSELIEAVEKHLKTVHGFRLLTPPYQKFNPSIGLLSATQPGRLENGGNYCHGTMFMTYALCLAGQRARALEALESIFPINPLNPPAISRQEPYSLTNSYCAPESGGISGRSHFSWRSGTAGWAFRSAIEGIMGVVATMNGLEVASDLPVDTWDHASLKRTIRGKTLHIEWQRTGTPSRTLNGKPITSEPLQPDDWTETENTLHITF
ncbi:GH36-type glycosyl hydrolase domain-containing protein [Cerasicoccus fimbriatus]|uniref:GH36-type glycosyl hydrolase domain-containing protein n=1 Tax=Cerasicoccus fimbriatus TaxID=3014554 RepID=UPI0022B461DD|nr:hypothetical protein [Cerasicoccus sp. TK19100]